MGRRGAHWIATTTYPMSGTATHARSGNLQFGLDGIQHGIDVSLIDDQRRRNDQFGPDTRINAPASGRLLHPECQLAINRGLGVAVGDKLQRGHQPVSAADIADHLIGVASARMPSNSCVPRAAALLTTSRRRVSSSAGAAAAPTGCPE